MIRRVKMALTQGTNSYATDAEALDYFNDAIHGDAWLVADSTDRERALVTASRRISLLVNDDCKLPITPADIPEELKVATYEYAFMLLSTPDLATQTSTGSNLKRVRADTVEAEFFRATTGTPLPSIVMQWLRAGDCLGGSSAPIGGAQSFGTSGTSEFTDRDRYGRSKGYY